MLIFVKNMDNYKVGRFFLRHGVYRPALRSVETFTEKCSLFEQQVK